jgi:hypothetical protein
LISYSNSWGDAYDVLTKVKTKWNNTFEKLALLHFNPGNVYNSINAEDRDRAAKIQELSEHAVYHFRLAKGLRRTTWVALSHWLTADLRDFRPYDDYKPISDYRLDEKS